jgi:hypothetical protein
MLHWLDDSILVKLPGAQDVQVEAEEAPTVFEYVPVGQRAQTEDLFLSE